MRAERWDSRLTRVSSSLVARSREVGAHICYGVVRRVTDEEARSAQPGSSPYRICQVVMRPDGELQCSYDKLHLCHYMVRAHPVAAFLPLLHLRHAYIIGYAAAPDDHPQQIPFG